MQHACYKIMVLTETIPMSPFWLRKYQWTADYIAVCACVRACVLAYQINKKQNATRVLYDYGSRWNNSHVTVLTLKGTMSNTLYRRVSIYLSIYL